MFGNPPHIGGVGCDISQQLAQRQPTVTHDMSCRRVNPVGQSTVRGGRRGRFKREQANHCPTSSMLRVMQVLRNSAYNKVQVINHYIALLRGNKRWNDDG